MLVCIHIGYRPNSKLELKIVFLCILHYKVFYRLKDCPHSIRDFGAKLG